MKSNKLSGSILTITVMLGIIGSLFIRGSVFAANKPDHKIKPVQHLQNETTNQNSISSERWILPGMIILKFKESVARTMNSSLSSLPAIEAKIARYEGYRLDAAFPFLENTMPLKSTGLEGIYYFYYHNGDHPEEVAKDFARDPNIDYAEPRYVYTLYDTPDDPYYSSMVEFPYVQADTAWGIVKGSQGNVIVAVVDGGTDWDHQDLLDNVWENPGEIAGNGIDDDNNGFIDDVHGWNFSNNSNDPTGNPATPQSAAHGTHVAGTAAGVTDNGTGISSISWNATLMPINAAHPTSDRSILYGYDGIVYAAANGADVVNCSWGGAGAPSNFEQDVIDFAYQNGTLVVAAAGNAGVNNDITPHYPSNYDKVLSVGAVNRNSDFKASFSNYGVTVDVFAPGVNITSTTPNNTYQGGWGGTSMASPMAAGLAALVKTQNPGMSVDELREQLRVTSVSIDAANPSYNGLLGKGRIDALKSVTEFNHPAIRVVDQSFTDSGGDGIINAGETIDADIFFTNYLSNTSNVSVTLTENDNNITITNGTGNIATFNSGDTLSVSFQFQVGVSTPDGYVLRFLLNMGNGSYSDRDYVEFVVNPPQFLVHDTGLLQAAVTDQGNIGYVGFNGASPGAGFVYNGQDFLFEGGLMIGTGVSTVSDCIRGGDGQTQDDDFKPAAEEILTIVSPGSFTTEEGSILMVDSLATIPLGLEIQQKSYADTSAGQNGYIIMAYEITNPTASAVTNLYVGLFFDWDINLDANDYARYEAGRNMGYVQNNASSPNRLAATRLLTGNANISYRSINNPTELYDGFTDQEKWNFLSGGLQTQNLNGVDVSTLLSAGPISIAAGATQVVAFAVVGGNSLTELQANADNADNSWNNPGTPIEPQQSVLPENYILHQNFPNPFNPTTTISFQLPISGEVGLKIFNVTGQEVRTLVNGFKQAGSHEFIWDGKDNAGISLASGVYFYQLTIKNAENMTLTRKMMFLK
ncbi:MAG: S8 family serine peptidase [bacterium]|nr:MAG: S8 family serine peptidase [bacterium]